MKDKYDDKIEEGFAAVEKSLEITAKNYIDERLEPTEKWVSRIEATMNTARHGRLGPGDPGPTRFPQQWPAGRLCRAR